MQIARSIKFGCAALLVSATALAPLVPARAHSGTAVLVDSHQYEYARGPRKLQTLDIYHTTSLVHAPVVVMVHGGAWRGGDKSDRDVGMSRARGLVQKHCVYVSINYRLAPAAKYPSPVQDLANALSWLQKHVAKYGGDPGNIILVGHSAGGHIVALALADWHYLRDKAIKPTGIKAAVLLDPAALDLVDSGSRLPYTSNTQLTDAFGKDADKWSTYSPLYQLKTTAMMPVSPQLIIALSKDQFKNRRQAEDLIATYKNRGGKARLMLVPQVDHTGMLRHLQLSDQPLTLTFKKIR